MPKILKSKVTTNEYLDAIGVALVKNVEERLLAPIVGNGTIGSGLVKGIGGMLTPQLLGSNKYSRMITTALIVDSAEDLINGFMGGMNLSGGSSREVI